MWLSAIVPWFSFRFGNLTVQGRCCRIFELTLFCFFLSFCRSRVGVPRCPQVCPHRVASPLHRPATAPLAWLHRHLRYNHYFFVLGMYLHVTQLGVSRSKEIGLQICRSLHIYNRICFELSTFFWTARGCVDGVSFHGLLRSETESRQYLPVVLRIHNLPVRTCIWRTAGRCCRISVSDRTRPWELTPSMHPRVGLGPILTY